MRARKGPGALRRPTSLDDALARLPTPDPTAEARRLREPPEEVELHACLACGAVSLARYGAGEPPAPPAPCPPTCGRPGGSQGLLRLRYARRYSAP